VWGPEFRPQNKKKEERKEGRKKRERREGRETGKERDLRRKAISYQAITHNTICKGYNS
jgi:hypothetical protein